MPTNPLQIVVLGMHRSGTSALTGALHRMGVYVGDEQELTGKSWENPQGFFEHRDARKICDALLHGADADWWKVSSFDVGNIRQDVRDAQTRALQELVTRLNGQAEYAWVLKEPRLCLLFPALRAILENPFALIMSRHPVEVARSLRRRNGFPMQAGLALWEVYMTSALKQGRRIPHALVSYNDLVAAPGEVLERVAKALGTATATRLDLEAGAASIKPELRRELSEEDDDDWLSPGQRDLWLRLRKAEIEDFKGGVAHRSIRILREFEIDQKERTDLIEKARILERKIATEAQQQSENSALKEDLRQATAKIKQESSRTSALSASLKERQEEIVRRDEELGAARKQIEELNNKTAELAAERDIQKKREKIQEVSMKKIVSQRGADMKKVSEGLANIADRLREIEEVKNNLVKLQGEIRESRQELRLLANEAKRQKHAERYQKHQTRRRDNLLQELNQLRIAVSGWRAVFKFPVMPLSLFRMRRLIPRAIRIAASPIFDGDWYLKQNPDVKMAGMNPALHYVADGGREGRAPSLLFDPSWWVDHEGVQVEKNQTALELYLDRRLVECADPHPLFLRKEYLEENPGVAEAGLEPLEHFLLSGSRQVRSPHPEFDAVWYLERYPDVAEAGVNPLVHFLANGASEGRDPSKNFSTQGYLDANPELAVARVNPLVHWVVKGRSEGRGQTRGVDQVQNKPAGRQREHAQQVVPIRQPKLPLTVLIISWDIGHNPLGRAYMVAEVVDRVVHHTIIAGFQFPRYGQDVWPPLKNSRLPVIPIPGGRFPDFLETAERIAATVKPDVVIACKPRLPSLQLGLQIKELAGCPLILDIDDHELSFFEDQTPFDLTALEAMAPGALEGEDEPYEAIWTRLSESLISEADARLVSNTALQKKYGGTLVPHARDETVFSVADLKRRNEMRQRYGIPVDAKALLFCGTPRLHKGIGTLAKAVAAIDDPAWRLVIVGDAPDRSVFAALDRLAPERVIRVPNQSFESLPDVLACADVVALPQDVDHPISLYQLPAKAIDAIAAGVPLLVSRTPPLMDLVRDGVAEVLEADRLSEDLVRVQCAGATPTRARAVFEGKYSYAALARTLREVIGGLKTHTVNKLPQTDAPSLGERLIAAETRAIGLPAISDRSGESPAAGVDIVVFWKQNDTTLYGRRSDMVVKYLASRPDVRRVVVFDAPISQYQLAKLREARGEITQHRHIYTRTQEKLLGLHDTPKVRYRVFAYPPDLFDRGARPGDPRPQLTAAVINHVRETLLNEGIVAERAVFWLYPKNRFLTPIVDALHPGKTVVDIVDDHRAWPSVSSDERDWLTEQYSEVLSRADFAFANCEPVRDSMLAFFPGIRLIPNGCDPDPDVAEPRGCESYKRLKSWPGKVLGFVGNLESKIDIDLLERLADEFPNALLALVGSTHANPDVRRLACHTNVVMPGVVPYEESGAWVRCFDVGLIPHRKTEMTKNMNPLKLFVYAVHGVPVVATDVPNLAEWDGLCVAKDSDEFIAAVGRTISRGGKHSRKVVSSEFISKNSWRARFDSVVRNIIAASEGNLASRST